LSFGSNKTSIFSVKYAGVTTLQRYMMMWNNKYQSRFRITQTPQLVADPYSGAANSAIQIDGVGGTTKETFHQLNFPQAFDTFNPLYEGFWSGFGGVKDMAYECIIYMSGQYAGQDIATAGSGEGGSGPSGPSGPSNPGGGNNSGGGLINSSTKSSLPSWLLPAGAAAGALLLIVLLRRRKPKEK